MNTMMHRLCSTSVPRMLNRAVPSRRFISTQTPICFAKMVMKVPTMGDSITEGTIVEWTVAVGQAVKEGDVVALVETDKVTVDIKAETDGVLTQQFGAVDETVEVGAKLYEIDTEAQVTADTAASEPHSAPIVDVPSAAPVATETSTPAHTDDAHHSRLPSISFLGREGWASRLSGVKHEPVATTPLLPAKPHAVVVMDGSMLSSRYGRPAFSEEEMEALMLGGANVAPSVVVPSSGAVFAVNS